MNAALAQARARGRVRIDHKVIAEWIDESARVFDIGCDDGALLDHLVETKKVDARGMELSNAGVNLCVAKGLSVMQGDADLDLKDYPEDAFDYAILSQTLQAVNRPKDVLDQMLRIGRRAIVSFPNFGHWRSRIDLALYGRMPQNGNLPIMWYETPNIHFCTIRDFVELTEEMGLTVDRFAVLDENGAPSRYDFHSMFANLFGSQALFQLSRKG